AVDGADDRFRKPAKGADQRIVALLDRLAEIWTAFARRDRAIAEILSAAKALAGAGQQHGAALVVLRGAPDGIGERLVHRDIEGVHPLGPVEGERQHPLFELLQQDRLSCSFRPDGHGVLPGSRLMPRIYY